METIITQIIPLKDIQLNRGQLPGLPKNPRTIKDDSFKRLLKSIKDNPEMLALRELLVYPLPSKKYIIIGGNMRYRACKELGYTELPCKVIPEGTSIQTLKAYTIKDNGAFGDWDMDLLANEWDNEPLHEWGIPIDTTWTEEKQDNSSDIVDKGYMLKVECTTPSELDALKNRLKMEGYKVR